MLTWFAYEFTDDITASRAFYLDLIGMEAVWDEEDSFAFVHGSVQVLFSQAGPQFHDDEHGETARGHVAHCATGWAFQPGWGHGQVPLEQETARMRSSSIALSPDQFLKAVERVTAAGFPHLFDEPSWVGYWSFPVQDPDGTTVELTDPKTGEDALHPGLAQR